MKVGDLVTTIRHLPGAPIIAIRGGALALIVGFDKDNDPIVSYIGSGRWSEPHPVFRFNVQVLSSGQNLSED